MALKATIFKAELSIADMDRHYYESHSLTLARHPSETDARMMARLVAFALNASESLSFTKGISTDDEPDSWQKNLSDESERWVELGQPDEKRLRKACGRAQQVLVYTYSERAANVWWQQNRDSLMKLENIRFLKIDPDAVDALTELVTRNMQLHCSIQDQQLHLGTDAQSITVTITPWD